MKIKYLDRNWEAVGEKEVSLDYLLPDKVVCNYKHIAEIRPDEKLSFLDTIHVGPFEDIVEFKNGFEQIFFIDVGKVLKNSFNISLFFEKIENDSNGLAKILNKEMVENIEPDTLIPENCAGIEIDILTVDYGMIFIHIPQYKSESYTLESLLETAKKIDHFFFIIFQEINEIGEGVIPLIPSYAYNMKKGKIFISHASKDIVFARKLRDSLRSENLDTWFDEDDILVGDDFVESIEKGLIESDYIVIVLSPNFNNGPWATKEYRAALTEQINNGKIKILPVKYKKCTPPLLLNSISHADLSKNFDGGLKQLVRTIHRRYFKEKVDNIEI